MKEEVLKGNNLCYLSSLFESGDKNTVKNMLSNETINHYEKFPLGNNFHLVFYLCLIHQSKTRLFTLPQWYMRVQRVKSDIRIFNL